MKKLLLILLLVTLCPAQYRGVKPMLGTQVDWSHPLSRGLVGYWSMQEGSGGTIYDISGYGNHGTLEADTHWVPGKFGPCLDFDGDGDYVQAPNPSFASDTEGTIVLWFYRSDSGTDKTVFYCGDSGSNNNFFVFNIDGVERPKFRVKTSSDILSTGGQAGTLQFSTNTWYQVAYVAHSSGNTIYIDGLEYTDVDYDTGSSSTQAWFGNLSGVDACELGRRDVASPGQYFNGQIDNVLIFDRALSASEITQLYLEPFCLFEQPTPELYVSSGGEPPTTAPQFIMIQLSKIPAWFVVAVIISVLATAIGTTKRKAA